MKYNSFAALAVFVVSGCTTATTDTTPVHYDLTAVCLTDQGKPVSEGGVYNGKKCLKPETMLVYPKPELVWR
ncbi:hypothetical protein [Pseudochrobactrum lubricantis]|uniref:hypothetical protein n=1 Tax=Pseudochrobactrum lubricantis TaxID=558172 RepID=UPI0035D8AEAF